MYMHHSDAGNHALQENIIDARCIRENGEAHYRRPFRQIPTKGRGDACGYLIFWPFIPYRLFR